MRVETALGNLSNKDLHAREVMHVNQGFLRFWVS